MFRDSAGKHRRTPADILADVHSFLQNKISQIDALTLAAEFECALVDLRHPLGPMAEKLTDAIAAERCDEAKNLVRNMELDELPPELVVNTPEGFAYYALDPVAFADKVFNLCSPKKVAVVGIRSAGVALAALCAARVGSRVTVRPHGHPYDREVALSDADKTWIRKCLCEGKEFFVVDEGPGLSGSSFLCVAEALEKAGVPRERLHLIGSRAVDPSRLVARDARQRWARFDFDAVTSQLHPEEAVPISAGSWRGDDDDAPALWAQLMPATYESKDKKILWRFEGIGTAGRCAAKRARQLNGAAESLPLAGSAHGFNGYQTIPGRRAKVADLDAGMIERLAGYCAFRRTSFPSISVMEGELCAMTVHNVKQLLGIALENFSLETVFPVVCDARIAPYTWLISGDRILKTEATTHGDSHFFPGPCDIAWDIAGAIVEWRMDENAAAQFIAEYERRSGDRVSFRSHSYRIAYCAFHAAYAVMAAANTDDAREQAYFGRDTMFYKGEMARLIGSRGLTAKLSA